MSDPRNFEYFRCPDCKGTWRVWAPYSYDPGDSHPCFTPQLCDNCAADREFQESGAK